MFNFFDSLSTLFSTITDFIISALVSILDLIEAVPRMVTFLVGSFAYIPPFCRSFCYIVIAMAVIYLFVGRKGDV